MKEVTIYTDGACSGNPGPGGWAALLIYNNNRKTISGAEADTTNNRMELLAVIRALQTLKTPCTGKLFTDSTYVQQGVTSWLKKWKNNNWTNSSKSTIKNLDLWQELDLAINKHRIEFYWVRAHNGHPENELVDNLARQECLSINR